MEGLITKFTDRVLVVSQSQFESVGTEEIKYRHVIRAKAIPFPSFCHLKTHFLSLA